MSRWISVDTRQPDDGQRILAKFKHGVIECDWDDRAQLGQARMRKDFKFSVKEWMSMEDFELWANEEEHWFDALRKAMRDE